MSLKAELETWAAALKAYDEEDFDTALQKFATIGDSSKILTNMGLIYATLGEHEAAVEQFIAATQLDQYLAVAYFQCGVSNFLLTRYDLAYKDFDEALLYLRGNQSINYEQLGLKFKLFSAEVLFNKGLSLIYMGRLEEGLIDLDEAKKEKATDEHNVIDDAIADRGDGYTVFSIPVGVLYRPSENKLKNAKAKDYMGKAKLVATSDVNEQYTTFTGVTRLKQGILPSGAYLDDAANDGGLGRANTVAVTSRPTVPDVDRPVPLQRAKTTINVPADARERIGRASSNPPSPIEKPGREAAPRAAAPPPAAASAAVARSITSASNARGVAPGGPVRGLSTRRPGAAAPALAPTPALVPGSRRSPADAAAASRSPSDIYDDYIDAYDQPSPESGGRTAEWARSNTTRRQPSSYAPSSQGSVRRRVTKRTAPPRRSVYEEEEEGYGSGGDIDEYEMLKIRVKLHYQDDVRGMAIDATMPFDEFIDRLTAKFDRSFDALGIKFKDEDGGKVTLRDESDYELAIETARESAKGKMEGRLEVWCTDI
ncbi:NADPH oxidase regulator NoxR [Cristinia sonorae]|uniref:NADPH oxidase regulator NoxR n=1 Tax=Cristinia sonorae TaxID=1940300 RepID=A0A8K0UKG0_9AGAR|nr:NADPH oxidase regulator NoxR [Cristinia sonorae]